MIKPADLARLTALYSKRIVKLIEAGELDPRTLPQSPFCAICTGETGPFDQLPLGRRDALVWVCQQCNDEHPKFGRYDFSGGKEVGGVATVATRDDGRTREKPGR